MINLDVPEKNVRFLSYPPTIEQEEMIGRLVSFAGSGQWEDLGLEDVYKRQVLPLHLLG